jgi:hypothetical protein
MVVISAIKTVKALQPCKEGSPRSAKLLANFNP